MANQYVTWTEKEKNLSPRFDGVNYTLKDFQKRQATGVPVVTASVVGPTPTLGIYNIWKALQIWQNEKQFLKQIN